MHTFIVDIIQSIHAALCVQYDYVSTLYMYLVVMVIMVVMVTCTVSLCVNTYVHVQGCHVLCSLLCSDDIYGLCFTDESTCGEVGLLLTRYSTCTLYCVLTVSYSTLLY